MKQNLSDVAAAEEQRETVREAAEDFLHGEWDLSKLRELFEGPEEVDAPALWQGMQSLDWDKIDPFGTSEDDELGLGAGDFCAIVEETGRALAPTPLVSCVVGRSLLRSAGADAATSTLPVLAHAEAERSTDPLYTSVTAKKSDAGFVLHGSKRFVPYAAQADLLIVNATLEDGTLGLFQLDPQADGVERKSLELLDRSACAEVTLSALSVPSSACLAAGEETVRLLREALAFETLARCAELTGVAAQSLDLVVEYAKQRIAFDRPIGSFQAVQHKLVNLRGSLEVARALYRAAATVSWSEIAEREVAVSMAAYAALDDLRKVPEGAVQVFGGIGVTWEHDIHFYLRRAATLCALLAPQSSYCEVVARHLENSA